MNLPLVSGFLRIYLTKRNSWLNLKWHRRVECKGFSTLSRINLDLNKIGS